MTGPQAAVLRYLARAGHASDKAVARMLWGNPRQHRRADAILQRLHAEGLVTLVPRPDRQPGARRSWCLTDAGAQAMTEGG